MPGSVLRFLCAQNSTLTEENITALAILARMNTRGGDGTGVSCWFDIYVLYVNLLMARPALCFLSVCLLLSLVFLCVILVHYIVEYFHEFSTRRCRH